MKALPGNEGDGLNALLAWCFSHQPRAADWEGVLSRPAELNVESLCAEIENMGAETSEETIEEKVAVWRLQQKLRIALRHRRGLPLKSGFTCGLCGVHETDPVLLQCLPCADVRRQIAHLGSRGSCHFHWPAFDPVTSTWGVLTYTSCLGDERVPMLCYAVLGYASHAAALADLMPLSNYVEHLMANSTSYLDIDDVVDFCALVAQQLPMTPEAWRAFCRDRIIEHFRAFDPSSLAHAISWALSDIERQDRDPA